MPNLSGVRSLFADYLNTNWTETPIYWENVAPALQLKEPWINPNLIIDFSENATINDGRTRHSGQYIIRVYTALSLGTGRIYELSSQLVKLLQNKTLDGNLLTYAGSIRIIGDIANGWYQINVLIPFHADQQSTD